MRRLPTGPQQQQNILRPLFHQLIVLLHSSKLLLCAHTLSPLSKQSQTQMILKLPTYSLPPFVLSGKKFTRIKYLCSSRYCYWSWSDFKRITIQYPVFKERHGFLENEIKGWTFSVLLFFKNKHILMETQRKKKLIWAPARKNSWRNKEFKE